jgi:Hypothetical glycosyl hydrolase 6/Beta-galactosidase trimerisation domain
MNARTNSRRRPRHPGRALVWTFFVLATAVARANAAGAAPPPWFERSIVGMEVGPTGAQSGCDPNDVGYAAKFDGHEIVRRCRAAGCEYVVIWARDGEFAYYDSKVVAKCPGLGRRDVLREAVEEARAQKLPLIAYCVVQQGGQFLETHPEMAMRDPDGKLIGRFCLNSTYLGTMKALTSEMLAYGIAGFHIDMLDQGFGPPYGCWCATCRARFQSEYGHPMPRGVTWDADWDNMLEFRYNTSQRFERALCGHIKSVAPAASVDYNYHGYPPFSWEVGQRPVQHAGNADFVTGETGVWGFSVLGVGLSAEFYRAATPGRPVQIAMSRDVRVYHNQTTRTLNDLRWELYTLLAHGAFVTVVDKTGYDGRLDPVAYRRLGAAFEEAKARRDTFAGRPVQDVAVYFSSRTRDWQGRDDPARYFQAFQGAHQALVVEHIPWGVALDENATAATLGAFPVVVVPNASIVSPREAAMFRQYVEGGGNLIVTGWTGTLGPRGEPAGSSTLESLIGAKLVRRLDTRDNHVKFPSKPSESTDAVALRAGIEPDWTFLVEGPAVVYEPTTATPIGELFKPHRTVRQKQGREGTEWPLSADAVVGPAALVNKVGKGRVVTLAASPDVATAGEHHTVEDRRLLTNAVRLLHPKPRVTIDAPAFVETVVTEDPASRTIRVHLIGYAPTPTTTPPRNRPYVIPGPIEDAPMFPARIHLSVPPRSARAINRDTVVLMNEGSVGVVVSDIHEVITIGY